MILSTNIVNIECITINNDFFYNYSPNWIKNNISKFIGTMKVNTMPNSWLSRHPTLYGQAGDIYNAKCIYLGTPKSIDIEINNKLNPLGPDTFKKVYFDPKCNYPRFKLSSLPNIKKSNDPSKADSVIISPSIFSSYTAYTSVSDLTLKDILILYSQTRDTYYFINYYPSCIGMNKQESDLQWFYSKYADPQTEGLYRWASALINSESLPQDCKEFYYGEVVLFNKIEDAQFIINLFTCYKLLTYDTELDRFISNSLQKPTVEDIKTIRGMMLSSDLSVVDMGIKLLSSYNILTSIGAIGLLVTDCWYSLKYRPTSRSVGFNKILNCLGLKRDQLNNRSVDEILNILYKSCVDAEDKEATKRIIIQRSIDVIESCWKLKHKGVYSNIDLTLKFTIE